MYASELYKGLISGWTSCQIVLFMSEIQKESPNTLILSIDTFAYKGFTAIVLHWGSIVWHLQGEGQIQSPKHEIAP